MHTAIPTPLRAAAGLAAVVIDEARQLPRRVVTLPVLAASTAMQTSLKAQQRYAELAVRGDQLLAQLRGGGQTDTPSWARFDEDENSAADADTNADAADERTVADVIEPGTSVQPVLVDYDELSIPQLRARMRRLDETQLAELISYERAHANRPPYVTMLENRLAALS